MPAQVIRGRKYLLPKSSTIPLAKIFPVFAQVQHTKHILENTFYTEHIYTLYTVHLLMQLVLAQVQLLLHLSLLRCSKGSRGGEFISVTKRPNDHAQRTTPDECDVTRCVSLVSAHLGASLP
jgi:hypothetical protein